MKKILFLIHDLGSGGAEKVLVNLVNHLDRSKFDISVIALFGGGINEQFLRPDVHFHTVWPKMIPGNSKLMKLLSPKQLHRLCVKESYDIEVSYLEGPSARVISGCEVPQTKLISWIHVEQHTMGTLASAFRNEAEASACYNRFHQTVCVSQYVKNDFCTILNFKNPCAVLYNTVESDYIREQARRPVEEIISDKKFRLVAVGTLKKSKGYDRLLNIVWTLIQEGYALHLYILGTGPLEQKLKANIAEKGIEDSVTLLGYHTNPYKFISKCNLFVCSSYSEGFSTAATEALIVGTPVCTVEVSGMKEMLGSRDEYGVVTENNEEALLKGIRRFLDDANLLEYYKKQAELRGEKFCTQKTVSAVEELLMSL